MYVNNVIEIRKEAKLLAEAHAPNDILKQRAGNLVRRWMQ